MSAHLAKKSSPVLAPMLFIKNLAAAMEFYKKAFDATELRHVRNDDGTVHVAELFFGDAVIRLHEEVSKQNQLSPDSAKGTTVVIGLLVDDPDAVAKKAIAAGAIERSPVQDYDYGYRQGTVIDPFGHQWMIEKNTPI